MTTQYIFLPPLGAVPIYNTPGDLPVAGTLGEIVSVISDGTVRQWNGTVWNSIGGLAAVTDTNSIDLTNTSGNVSADLKLSAASATLGNQKLALSIASDGLLAQIPVANTSTSGSLTSTDWNTFNNKVSTTRSLATTAPLSGGGDLSADRTLSITQSTTSTNGFLSSADWNTFNNKVSTTRTLSTTAPLAGGGDLSADRTLSITQATTSASGFLTNTDWNTFNNKQNAITVTAVGAGTANGLALSGGNLNVHAATATQPGVVTTAAQTWGGNKTFNGNILKANNTTNASFTGLLAPASAAPSAANLASATVTVGGSNGYTFSVDLNTGESMLLQASQASALITALSDVSNLFLTSDAGTGIFVSKSAASNVITLRNRMGGARNISVIFFGDTVTSATAWV